MGVCVSKNTMSLDIPPPSPTHTNSRRLAVCLEKSLYLFDLETMQRLQVHNALIAFHTRPRWCPGIPMHAQCRMWTRRTTRRASSPSPQGRGQGTVCLSLLPASTGRIVPEGQHEEGRRKISSLKHASPFFPSTKQSLTHILPIVQLSGVPGGGGRGGGPAGRQRPQDRQQGPARWSSRTNESTQRGGLKIRPHKN